MDPLSMIALTMCTRRKTWEMDGNGWKWNGIALATGGEFFGYTNPWQSLLKFNLGAEDGGNKNA